MLENSFLLHHSQSSMMAMITHEFIPQNSTGAEMFLCFLLVLTEQSFGNKFQSLLSDISSKACP